MTDPYIVLSGGKIKLSISFSRRSQIGDNNFRFKKPSQSNSFTEFVTTASEAPADIESVKLEDLNEHQGNAAFDLAASSSNSCSIIH